MSDQDLTAREQQELNAMRTESSPPAHLEDRVVESLRIRSEIKRTSRIPFRKVAAAAVIFIAGYFAGTWRPLAYEKPQGQSFVLFLYESEGSTGSVAEHKAWARDLAAQGKIAGGTKLASESYGADGTQIEQPIGGYFVIQAPDWQQALAIARTCPHVRHGGRVIVRKVDPV